MYNCATIGSTCLSDCRRGFEEQGSSVWLQVAARIEKLGGGLAKEMSGGIFLSSKIPLNLFFGCPLLQIQHLPDVLRGPYNPFFYRQVWLCSDNSSVLFVQSCFK